MFKKLFTIIFATIFLYSCGYTPIYSSKTKKNLNIELLNFVGDREINNSIKYNLKRHQNQNNEEKIYISVNTTYSKNVETRNLAGNVTTYNLASKINIKISYNDVTKTFQFEENASMNDQSNQLDENIYEKNIKQNFAEIFTNKLIIKLLKLK
tara:strand:- start:280 stop:738 length:459 start_codon:yes stop_codon:yes gene_type:complete